MSANDDQAPGPKKAERSGLRAPRRPRSENRARSAPVSDMPPLRIDQTTADNTKLERIDAQFAPIRQEVSNGGLFARLANLFTPPKAVRALGFRVSAPFREALRIISKRDGSRFQFSLIVAIWINLVVLTSLTIFGEIRIFAAAPRVIDISLSSAPVAITIVSPPEVEEAPEPEPEEPEEEPEPEPEEDVTPIEEPEPEVAQTPKPEAEQPEPEPATEPEEEPAEESAPAPEIRIDLNRDPAFAPEAQDPAPFIPDPIEIVRDQPTSAGDDPRERTADEDAFDLLDDEQRKDEQDAGLDEIVGADTDDGEDQAEAESEKDDAQDDGEVQPDSGWKPPLRADSANDNRFDSNTRFYRRGARLPPLSLPQSGDVAADPGSAGSVAILCPEHFSDDDKAKECAGRREILSGWRPGDSDEDWSRATALIGEARSRGDVGPDLELVIGEKAVRELKDQRIEEELTRPGRTVQDLSDPVGSVGGDIGIGSGAGPEPGWAYREDGQLSQEEIDEFERKLREAQANQ